MVGGQLDKSLMDDYYGKAIMHKENIVAVLFGFVLGFGVAAGILFFPQFAKRSQDVGLPKVLDEGKSIPSPKETLLSLTLPEDFEQSKDGKIFIKGKTKPKTILVVTTSDADWAFETDPTGSFEQSIKLSVGTHDVFVTAYLADQTQETVQRTVLILPKVEE